MPVCTELSAVVAIIDQMRDNYSITVYLFIYLGVLDHCDRNDRVNFDPNPPTKSLSNVATCVPLSMSEQLSVSHCISNISIVESHSLILIPVDRHGNISRNR